MEPGRKSPRERRRWSRASRWDWRSWRESGTGLSLRILHARIIYGMLAFPKSSTFMSRTRGHRAAQPGRRGRRAHAGDSDPSVATPGRGRGRTTSLSRPLFTRTGRRPLSAPRSGCASRRRCPEEAPHGAQCGAGSAMPEWVEVDRVPHGYEPLCPAYAMELGRNPASGSYTRGGSDAILLPLCSVHSRLPPSFS